MKADVCSVFLQTLPTQSMPTTCKTLTHLRESFQSASHILGAGICGIQSLQGLGLTWTLQWSSFLVLAFFSDVESFKQLQTLNLESQTLSPEP